MDMTGWRGNGRRRYWLVSPLAVIILLQGFPTWVSAKETWVGLQAKHFKIVTNAGEGPARGLALNLEHFRYNICRILSIDSSHWPPCTVVAFKDPESFGPFRPQYKGRPRHVGGFFQGDDDENLIALRLNYIDPNPMGIILHEYTHVITRHAGRQWPVWLNEGLAEVFSTFEVIQNKVELGRPVERHVRVLWKNPLIPLSDLLSINLHSPAYNDGTMQDLFYAESWALAHFLLFGDKSAHLSQLAKFIESFDSGATADAAFDQAFGPDRNSLELALRNYITGKKYGYATGMLDNESETATSARQLSDSEVQFYMGDVLVHANRSDDAASYFERAASLDQGSLHSCLGLGMVGSHRGDLAAAAEWFKQAAEHGPDDYFAHYKYAEALLAKGASSGPVRAETRQLIYAEVNRTIKLMPGFASSYYLLANLCLLTDGNMKQGLQWAKIAAGLEPQRARFALTLAQLEFHTEAYGDAKSTLALLLARDLDDEIRKAAESLLSDINDRAKSTPR